MDYIKERVKQVVQEVFPEMKCSADTAHQVDQWLTGGQFSDSENSDLNEMIESISNALKQAAGTHSKGC